MRIALSFLIILSFLLPNLLQAKEWRLAVCHGKQATKVDKKYSEVIGNTAARIFNVIDADSKLSLMVRECEKEPNFACYADKSAIYCREEPLALVTRMAAWLAADAALIYLSINDKNSALEQVPRLSWVDALLLADAEKYSDNSVFLLRAKTIQARRNLATADFDNISSLVIDIHTHIIKEVGLDRENKELVVASTIYKKINDYAFSFLLGHEGYHFNGNICPIATKSILETKNIWAEIYKLQLKKGLFDSKVTLDKHELNADLCGFKWMEANAKKYDNVDNAEMSALIKRTAIDLLAAPILTGGLNSFDVNELGNDAPKVKIVDGYLYPQSRLVLASATLHLSERSFPPVVKICNDTAKAIVNLIQNAVQHYAKSSGYVPDSLLAQLPPGVEIAWNDGVWSSESYRCKIGK
tara:strand:- start:606 stop:1841 length:1236 start_codon:yes stop_codon:yes gene_type:complete